VKKLQFILMYFLNLLTINLQMFSDKCRQKHKTVNLG
jgi:hypothetical protein